MNQSASPGSPQQRTLDEPAPDRRRLLKAAAAAAPLVATLPSGAARAMSSTSQCIKQGRTATQGGTVDNVTLGFDGYVRTQGYGYVYTKGSSNVTVYSIGDSPEQPYYFGDTGVGGSTAYKIGEVFNPATFDGGGWILTEGPTDVLLLKLYRAESDTGDPYSNPTCANNCTPDSLGAPLNTQCVFPRSTIGAPDQSGDNPGNNMGLSTSCQTSVHPNFTGESCPM